MLQRFKNWLGLKKTAEGLDRYNFYYHRSFSLAGEDMLLRHLLKDKKEGFYVDVGAFHPWRFSNTYYFYEKGWRGINVDANERSIQLFNKYRPRDINVHAAVTDREKKLTYYQFNEKAAGNTFSKDLVQKREKNLQEEKTMEGVPLLQLLTEYVPDQQAIDFLSVDVEGLEMEVLKGNDWSAYHPQYILIEHLNISYLEAAESEIYQFLTNHGYQLICKNHENLLFKSKQ